MSSMELDKIVTGGFGFAIGQIQLGIETAFVGGETDPKKKLARKAIVGLVELGTTLGTIGALIKTETGEDSVFSVIAAGYLLSKIAGVFFWPKRKEWTGAANNPEDPTLE